MEKKEFEVIIIGGGYSGCAAAYYFSKAGIEVALFEMNEICSGASGRNGGQVIQLEGREELNKDKIIKRNSITVPNKILLNGLSDELGTDVEFIKNGSLDVAFDEKDARIIKDVMKMQYETGDTAIEFIGSDKIHEICPAYGSNFSGAKLRRDDGSINPFKMTYGYAFAARKMGCKLLVHTKVNSLIIENGKVTGISTNKGDFFAKKAVVCTTNAWTKHIVEEYPVMPCKILGFVTEQLPIVPVLSAEIYALNVAIYGSSQKDGSILIGGAPYFYPKDAIGHLSTDIYFEDFIRYGNLFKYTWPNITDVSFIRAWAGAVAFTPDSFPLVGPTKYDNFYLDVGFTNGNSWCPICGKLIFEYIAYNGKTSVPIDFLNPERFADVIFDWPNEYNYTVLHNYIAKKME